jgi:hypothetical protein
MWHGYKTTLCTIHWFASTQTHEEPDDDTCTNYKST